MFEIKTIESIRFLNNNFCELNFNSNITIGFSTSTSDMYTVVSHPTMIAIGLPYSFTKQEYNIAKQITKKDKIVVEFDDKRHIYHIKGIYKYLLCLSKKRTINTILLKMQDENKKVYDVSVSKSDNVAKKIQPGNFVNAFDDTEKIRFYEIINSR